MANLRSKAFARVLDLVSEGEIEGLVDGAKSIYLNGTPLQNASGTYNFADVKFDSRVGTQSQSYIPGASSVESETVVGTEVTQSTSVTRTITTADVSAVRVTLSTPALFRQQDDGDTVGTSVEIAIDVQSGGGGFVPQIISRVYVAGTTTIGPAHIRSTSSGIFGLKLNVVGYDNTLHRVEYKLVSSGTWITTGLKFEYGSIDTGSWNVDTWESSYTAVATVTTPTLAAGQYEVRVVNISGGGAASVTIENPRVLAGSPTDIISGKSTSKYQRSYRIELDGSGPWDIRVRRLTSDSTSLRLNNKTFWDSFTEIIDAKLRYPNSALVSMRFDAAAFSGIPTRAYDLKLKRVKVPVNYNPTTRVYTGAWNGTFKTAWTDNPAWCFYDLVTNTRYGLGNYIPEAQVDKWALYTIAQYCDELVPDGLGGTEPRFTCNLYLQSREEAFKVINDMASCFRSMVYWAGGAMTLAQDAPADPVALFTQANVIDGVFTYVGSSAKARHTVALVTWNDPESLYEQKVEYVEDAEGITRYGVVPTEVVAIGCTSRGQANRVGRWILYAERNETETVTFTTGIEGATVRPGDIIKVADASRAGVRLGGRVRSATTTAVTLDAAVSLGAAAWTIYVMLPNGTVASSAVSSAAGNVVNLTTALAAAPQTGAQWVMSSTSTEAQTFRVLNVVEKEANVEITALKHEPLKYAAVEDGLVLPTRDITALTFTPAAPISLTLTEALYTYQAEVRAKIDIGWPNVQGASAYRVDWNKDGGNFESAISSISDYSLPNITPGTYVIRVYSIGPTGKESSTYREASITALGKTAPPANVTGGTAAPDGGRLRLTWNAVSDIDVVAYEVRTADGSFGSAGFVFRGSALTCFADPAAAGTSRTWYVRALDSSGRYSDASLSISYTAASPVNITAITETFSDTSLTNATVTLDWPEASPSFGLSGYEVTYGSVAKTVKASTITLPADWIGSRTFTVKTIDGYGNKSTGTSKTITKLAPNPVTNLRAQVIDNNVLLYWDLPARTTLPVQDVILKKGAAWATAETIGTKAGGFTSLQELQAGTYTYWVAARDTDNNQSTPVSVAAKVSEPPDFVFHGSYNSTFSGTKSSATVDSSGLVLPVNTTETWAQHFTTRSWSTPADQIAAGYPVFIQPGTGSGYYQEVFDFGAVLASSQVTVSYSGATVAGSPVLATRIETSDDNVTYTTISNSTSGFGTAFRYVRVRITVTGGIDAIYRMSSLNVRLDAKQRSDSGSKDVVSTDPSGTVVNFNREFIDVTSITMTGAGTAAATPVYDFQDANIPGTYSVTSNTATINCTGHGLIAGQNVRLSFTSGTAPSGIYTVASVTNANTFTATIVTANTSGNVSMYPQGFRAYLFTAAGARASGTLSWSVKGY